MEDGPVEVGDPAAGFDADAPVGPNTEEGADSLHGVAERSAPVLVPPAVKEMEAEEPVGELPKLADLNQRIPPEALAIIDELFRAKFIKVQRISAKHLKKN